MPGLFLLNMDCTDFTDDININCHLAESVDVDGGEDHEEGEDHDDDLEPLLEFATEDDGVEAALLEAGGTILTVVMVVVMFGH